MIANLIKVTPVCTCNVPTAGGDTDHRLILQAGSHMQILPSEDALLQSPHAALQQHQHIRARPAVPPGGETRRRRQPPATANKASRPSAEPDGQVPKRSETLPPARL